MHMSSSKKISVPISFLTSEIAYKLHKWLVLGLFLWCSSLFHLFMTSGYRASWRYQWTTMIKHTMFSAIFLCGILLATTNIGKKYRIITSILLLPAFAFTTITNTGDKIVDSIGPVVSWGMIIWSYWIIWNHKRS